MWLPSCKHKIRGLFSGKTKLDKLWTWEYQAQLGYWWDWQQYRKSKNLHTWLGSPWTHFLPCFQKADSQAYKYSLGTTLKHFSLEKLESCCFLSFLPPFFFPPQLQFTEKLDLLIEKKISSSLKYNLHILQFPYFKHTGWFVLVTGHLVLCLCNHHHNQDTEQFPVLKWMLVPLCSRSPPWPPVPGKHWSVFYPYSFPFCRVSYKWNHIVCSL